MPHLPHHLERHFIRGVFDGDGTISVNKKGLWASHITCASKPFLEDFHQILETEDIEVRISSYKKND